MRGAPLRAARQTCGRSPTRSRSIDSTSWDGREAVPMRWRAPRCSRVGSSRPRRSPVPPRTTATDWTGRPAWVTRTSRSWGSRSRGRISCCRSWSVRPRRSAEALRRTCSASSATSCRSPTAPSCPATTRRMARRARAGGALAPTGERGPHLHFAPPVRRRPGRAPGSVQGSLVSSGPPGVGLLVEPL